MSTAPLGTSATTARSRLTDDQEAGLQNLAASWAMEDMAFTEAELEVLATYVLGEISREDCVAQLTPA